MEGYAYEQRLAPDLGWKSLFPDLNVITIPGDHLGYTREPVLSLFVQQLHSALESGRQKLQDKLGPDPERTQKQIHIMRVWDELIQNKDRNAGNILWTKDWTLWLIDHTRAFRSGPSLLKPNELVRIERTLFERMKQLTEPDVSKMMKGILTQNEIRPILKRRDAIVAHFEKLIAERGETAVFFTLSPLAAP